MDAIDVNLARLKAAIAVRQRQARLPEPALIGRQSGEMPSHVPLAKQPTTTEHAKTLAHHAEDDRAPVGTNLWGRIRRSFGW